MNCGFYMFLILGIIAYVFIESRNLIVYIMVL